MKTEFYKMEYEAWDEGTDCLTLEQEGAYLRLCHQMYRRRSAIPNEPRMLARLWRCHTNKAKVLVESLIAMGKIHLTADGKGLVNDRVELELNRRGVSAKPPANPDQTPGKPKANLDQTQDQLGEGFFDNQLKSLDTDSQSRVEKNREESVSNAFEKFWKSYPKRKGGNPRHPAYLKFAAAVKAGADPELIVRSVKAYADECERLGKLGSEYVKQAQYWLNQRQWEDYNAAEIASQLPELVPVLVGTPQWAAHVNAGHNPNLITDVHDPTTGRRREGWHFKSEWPPDHSDKQAA